MKWCKIGFGKAAFYAGLAICILFLAACDNPSRAKKILKVGILHSQTGTLADSEKPIIDATLFAIEEINRNHTIPNTVVEPIIADGGSNPTTFAKQAEKLINKDGVVAIFGCWSSDSRKAVKPIVEEYENILFYPVQYEGIESSPNIYYLGATPNQQIIPAIHWAMQTEQKKRLFLVGSDYIFPHTANAIIKDQVHALGGEIVGESYIPLGSDDVSQVVSQIKKTRPDMVINTLNGSTNIAFFRKMLGEGIESDTIPTLSFSLGENEIKRIGFRHMAGNYAAWNYFQSIETIENRAFVKRFQNRFGETRATSDPMEAAYIAVHLWAESVADAMRTNTKAAPTSPEVIAHFMHNRSFKAPQGLVFIDEQTQHLYKVARIGRIEPNGYFKIIWTSDIPIRPQPYPILRTQAQWEEHNDKLFRKWGGKWQAPTKEE